MVILHRIDHRRAWVAAFVGFVGLVALSASLALIVNVKNKTVVTAVEKSPQEMGKVFTNIDSAFIM